MSARHMSPSPDSLDKPIERIGQDNFDEPADNTVIEPIEMIPDDGPLPAARHTSRSGKAVYGVGVKKPGGHTHRHHHHHGSGSSSHRSRRRRSSRSRKKRWKTVLIALLVLLVPVGIAFACVTSLNSSMSMGDEGTDLKKELEEQAQSDTQPAAASSAFYVLLVGSDAREGVEGGRGDVIMLTRVDPEAGQVTLVSIPRDTMITLTGTEDVVKINAAYAYGGAARQVHEVHRFAGVSISHYAEIDFEGLERLVDRLGGVRVNVPEAVGTGDGYIDAGVQTLNGEQALAYARQRYTATGGDFGRAQAQRLIVEAIIRQVLAASPLDLPSLISDLASCVSTDYTVTDLVALATQFQNTKMTLHSSICPSYALWEGEVAYVATMFDEWRDMMKRVDAGLDPDDTSVTIPEPQASNEKLGCAANSAAPKDYKEKAAENMTTDVVVDPGEQPGEGSDAQATQDTQATQG